MIIAALIAVAVVYMLVGGIWLYRLARNEGEVTLGTIIVLIVLSGGGVPAAAGDMIKRHPPRWLRESRLARFLRG